MEKPSVPNLNLLAKAARERLPGVVAQIEDLVRQADPIELLAHLSLLFQTHPEDEVPNRDEMAKWQVRIEWLTWLICARNIDAPSVPAVLDGSILTPLEQLLDEFFETSAATLFEANESLSPEQNQLRRLLKTEALFVRGEGFQYQFEQSAIELYSPHDKWCLEALGLTIHDALRLVTALADRYSDRIHATREQGHAIKENVTRNPAAALELRLPPAVLVDLKNKLPEPAQDESFAASIELLWFFFQAPEVVGFSAEELTDLVEGQLDSTRVKGFLDLMSFDAVSVTGEPDPFGLSPLAKAPFLHDRGRYFLLTPGTLLEALFYAFHARLFRDERYRARYDDSRAAIMEAAAVHAFRGLLPRATHGWRLKYGPKRRRTDLDGLIFYDGKLILIECKWKNLRLISRGGDVDATLADVDKAILQPLSQARRARDFIMSAGEAEFEQEEPSRTIVLRPDDVNEVFLVTLVGSGAWAHVAANLPRLTPLGLFGDGEYPWALSLSDLRVVGECLAGQPALLFDYLRRRARFQNDDRFYLHDEWDFLGVYLAGALDVDDPNFPKNADRITLDAFDSRLQDYYGSLGHGSRVQVEKPRRQIPENLWRLLADAEMASGPGRIDTLCLVLAWSDAELVEISSMLAKLVGKTKADGRAHAMAARHPARSVGIAISCGYKNQRSVQELLNRVIQTHQVAKGVAEWVGFGIDLAQPYAPLMVRSRFV